MRRAARATNGNGRGLPFVGRAFDALAVEGEVAISQLAASRGESDGERRNRAGSDRDRGRVLPTELRRQRVATGLQGAVRGVGSVGQHELLLAISDVQHLRL